MKTLQLPILLFSALFLTTLASPSGQQGQHGGVGGYQGNQGNQKQFRDAGTAQNARLQGGGEGLDESRKYRSNLYSDDDVYGYDAKYPNGEASFINYKSKDARDRRGEEFARTSRAASRGGGRGRSGHRQQMGYRGNGRGGRGRGGRGW